MGKYMKFYETCIRNSYQMPGCGLCLSLGKDRFLELIEPTPEECEDVSPEVMYPYWGDDLISDSGFSFTNTRQNIVLLMACLNNEKL